MHFNDAERPSGRLALRRWVAGWPGAVRIALAVGGSVLMGALALKRIDWSATWAALSHIGPGWLLGGLTSVALTAQCRAERWRLLFEAGHAPARPRLLGMVWGGQALNALIPARLGELARIWLAARDGPAGAPEAAWTVAAEKLLDSLTLLTAVVIVSIWAPLPVWLRSGAIALAIATLVSVGALSLTAAWRTALVSWLERLSARRVWFRRLPLAALLSAVSAGARLLWAGRLAWQLALWSALGFGAGMLTNWLTAQALGIEMSWLAAALLLTVLQMSAILPLPTLPGRAGLFHYLCVLALGLFGVAREPALGYALILHGLTYLPMAVAGPVSLAWLQRRGARR